SVTRRPNSGDPATAGGGTGEGGRPVCPGPDPATDRRRPVLRQRGHRPGAGRRGKGRPPATGCCRRTAGQLYFRQCQSKRLNENLKKLTFLPSGYILVLDKEWQKCNKQKNKLSPVGGSICWVWCCWHWA